MTRETQTRASPSKSYVKPQVDQQEEWVQGKPNNDNFCRKTSFTIVHDNCERSLPTEIVITKHDALMKNTMDKTPKNTLKKGINTTLPTCDDKGVFTDADDTYRKRK
jgi:hypothetical protein